MTKIAGIYISTMSYFERYWNISINYNILYSMLNVRDFNVMLYHKCFLWLFILNYEISVSTMINHVYETSMPTMIYNKRLWDFSINYDKSRLWNFHANYEISLMFKRFPSVSTLINHVYETSMLTLINHKRFLNVVVKYCTM